MITDALQNAYPAAVNSIFKSNTELKYLRIPKIDILLFIKITHINLSPIIKSKASINSNYCILETIFLKQLQLNYNNDFQNQLYLVYSNQKTAKLIYVCK